MKYERLVFGQRGNVAPAELFSKLVNGGMSIDLQSSHAIEPPEPIARLFRKYVDPVPIKEDDVCRRIAPPSF
jgi:hypothetical protein